MIPIYMKHAYNHVPIGFVDDDNEIVIDNIARLTFSVDELMTWIREGRYVFDPGMSFCNGSMKILELSICANPNFVPKEPFVPKQSSIDMMENGELS